MSGRRMRLALPALVVLLAGAVAVGVGSRIGRGDKGEAAAEPEFPSALGRHLEQLKEAIPGQGGESLDGRASSEEQAFLARAYPDNTISVDKMQAARSAIAAAAKRPFKGKTKPGEWASIGPSPATYPFTELRNSASYVPNKYDA